MKTTQNCKSVETFSSEEIPLNEDRYLLTANEKKKMERLQRMQDMKGVLRKAEGVLEVFLLSAVYYAIWRSTYRAEDIPFFYGNWKVVLVLIYAVLLFLIFYMCDSFKYGHRKLTKVVVSQWISVIIVDIITYFQICLINAKMVSFIPMLLILFLDGIITLFCSIIFARI